MAIKSLELTPLSTEQLQANNLLCGRIAQLTSQIHDQSVTLSLVPLRESKQLDFTLSLRIEGVDTTLQLSRSIFNDIILGNTSIADVIDQLPEPLLMGSLHLIFERLINDLRAVLQKDIQLLNASFQVAPITPALNITLDIKGQKHPGLLGINAQNKSWLESLPAASPNASLSRLPVPITLEAGRTTLTSHQIHHLRTQDIIFFDHNWYEDHSTVFVKISADQGFMAQINDQIITLTNTMEAPVSDDFDELDDFDDIDDDLDDLDDLDDILDGDTENTSAPETVPQLQPSEGSTPDVKNIPVQLTFDIGQQDIPLGNMAQLTPGFTFQLNRPIASPVIIHANGKPLAEGELVDVNGQLGTRITRML